MCTAISVNVKDHYFGRNLDYEHNFGEKIVITPRAYEFCFKNGLVVKEHYAIIGMALLRDNYPLYFDAVNEKGLGVAGLNFPEYAEYNQVQKEKVNIASFEFIPWILCRCKSVAEAENELKTINITNREFSRELSSTPLHWMISDKEKSVTVEQTKDGLFVYDNPAGVLTNSPDFEIQLFNLKNFVKVSAEDPENMISKNLDLRPYSRGMGGIGLPGDLSSMSRFVRAAFVKLNSVYGVTEEEVIHQFFHILYSVYQQKGCVKVGDKYEMTNYTSCCNTDKGIYYYTTYYNNSICAVDMYKEELNSKEIIIYDLESKAHIYFQNSSRIL